MSFVSNGKMTVVLFGEPTVFSSVSTYFHCKYSGVSDVMEFHTIVKALKVMFSDVIKNYESYLVYRETFVTPLPRRVLGMEETTPKRKKKSS